MFWGKFAIFTLVTQNLGKKDRFKVRLGIFHNTTVYNIFVHFVSYCLIDPG